MRQAFGVIRRIQYAVAVFPADVSGKRVLSAISGKVETAALRGGDHRLLCGGRGIVIDQQRLHGKPAAKQCGQLRFGHAVIRQGCRAARRPHPVMGERIRAAVKPQLARFNLAFGGVLNGAGCVQHPVNNLPVPGKFQVNIGGGQNLHRFLASRGKYPGVDPVNIPESVLADRHGGTGSTVYSVHPVGAVQPILPVLAVGAVFPVFAGRRNAGVLAAHKPVAVFPDGGRVVRPAGNRRQQYRGEK